MKYASDWEYTEHSNRTAKLWKKVSVYILGKILAPMMVLLAGSC